MRTTVPLIVLIVAVAGTCGACSSRRVGRNTPVARPDKGVVRVEGTRRVVGRGGDVAYDVRVARVDGAPAKGSVLTLDPGAHQIQLAWTRVEMPDAWQQGLNRGVDVSTRWVKTGGGCCAVDVDVRAGRVYSLVWDEQRGGRCPFCVVEVPQCP